MLLRINDREATYLCCSRSNSGLILCVLENPQKVFVCCIVSLAYQMEEAGMNASREGIATPWNGTDRLAKKENS